MPKISVLTCSVRPEGLPLVGKALKRQTFQDFEHIVQGREGSMDGNVWTLNQDMNTSFRKANGELVVSIQDWTFFKPDALQKFWDHYQNMPNIIVSGVGDKYTDDTWTVKTWADPRKRLDQGSFYPAHFMDMEGNFCAVPRKAIYAVGGADEALDVKYGMDWYSIMDRLNILGGWEFYLDQTNETFSLEHGRLNGEEWDKNNWNGEPYQEYRQKYLENPRLPYLA